MNDIEHFNRIDLKDRPVDPMWQIMLHLPHHKFQRLCDDMKQRKLLTFFNAKVKLFKCSSKKIFVFFTFIQSKSEGDNYRAIRCLLRLAHSNKYDIVWKEGKYGYKIDAHANIKQKWILTKPYQSD